MFGVSLDKYTLFHTAEDAAGCRYLYEQKPIVVRTADGAGSEIRVRMRRQDMNVKRRFADTAELLAVNGLAHRARLGRGHLLFIPSARAVHEFVVERLREDQYFLVNDDYRMTRGWSTL